MIRGIIFIIGIVFTTNTFSQSIEEKSVTEFQLGKVKKYSTHGLGKSNGLKLHIKYPQSWECHSGERPHVVQKIVQPDNYTILNLLINTLEEPLNKNEIDDVFTVAGLKTLLPSNSTYISSNSNLTIEGLRVASIDSYSVATRMNRQFRSYSRYYILFFEEYIVMTQFMIINRDGESDSSVKSRFEILKPLFHQISNSIVIDNVWE